MLAQLDLVSGLFCHRDCNGSVSCCRQQQPCSCQSEAYRRFGIQRMDHVFCRLVSAEFTTEQAGAKVLRCSRVRGRQMNAEASISRGKAILFLHATLISRMFLYKPSGTAFQPVTLETRFDFALTMTAGYTVSSSLEPICDLAGCSCLTAIRQSLSVPICPSL